MMMTRCLSLITGTQRRGETTVQRPETQPYKWPHQERAHSQRGRARAEWNQRHTKRQIISGSQNRRSKTHRENAQQQSQ